MCMYVLWTLPSYFNLKISRLGLRAAEKESEKHETINCNIFGILLLNKAKQRIYLCGLLAIATHVV